MTYRISEHDFALRSKLSIERRQTIIRWVNDLSEDEWSMVRDLLGDARQRADENSSED